MKNEIATQEIKMSIEEIISYLKWIRPINPYSLDRKKVQEAIDMAIKAIEQITKIADIVDGTIDHFDYDDAMDLLYEIKGVIK